MRLLALSTDEQQSFSAWSYNTKLMITMLKIVLNICLGSFALIVALNVSSTRADTVVGEAFALPGSSIEFMGQTYLFTLDEGLIEGSEQAAGSVNFEQLRQLSQNRLSRLEDLYQASPQFTPAELKDLAKYLRLLMPELDVGAPTSLQDVILSPIQREALFNYIYELRISLSSTATTERAPSDDLDVDRFVLQQLALSADRQFRCRYGLDVDDVNLGDKAGRGSDSAQKQIRISLREGADDCIGQGQAQLLWVNQLRIEDDLGSTGLAAEDIQEFLAQQLSLTTHYVNEGIEGIRYFDLRLLASAINKAYEASDGGQHYNYSANTLIMEQLERIRQQHAISFEDLRRVGDQLQDLYRSSGLILTKVYVPKQDFRAADGELELALVSGVLSDVYIRNIKESSYTESVLMPAFQSYLNQPVTEDISKAYFRLNDLPGLTVQAGFFEPGENDGQTRLNLGVVEERWRVNARADNYGSEGTGENRFIVGADWFNVLGRGDSLNLGVLQASSPSNTSYGFATYRYPVFGLTTDLRLAYEQTQYEAVGGQGGNKATSQGDLATSTVAADFRWFRSKDFNLTLSLAGLRKESDTTVTLQLGEKSVVDGLETVVDGAQFDIHVDYLSSALRALTDWRFSFFSGQQTDTNDAVISSEYDKFSLGSDTLFLLPINVFSKPIRFNTKLQGIYSDQLLPTFERQALGGPYGVKAFQTADFTGDATGYINSQLVMDIGSAIPWLRDSDHEISFGIFGEAAYGRLNGAGNASDSWAQFDGYGLLLYYRWGDRLNIETSATLGGNKKSSADFVDVISEPEKAFYISVNFNY